MKNYNKIKCVQSGNKECFTVGKVYPVGENGVTDNDGYTWGCLKNGLCVYHAVSGSGETRFIPVYDEKKEIHITVDGNKVVAVYKDGGKVVNRAESKCNPDDDFDFETGAEIALKRVFGNDVKVSADGKVTICIKRNVKEIKPYMVSKNTGLHKGTIGTETNYKDAIGRVLFVGDTVELYDGNNRYCGERSIVESNGKQFVMSIYASSDEEKGTTGDFKIIKKRGYAEIADGEIVDDIKYIKAEKGA